MNEETEEVMAPLINLELEVDACGELTDDNKTLWTNCTIEA